MRTSVKSIFVAAAILATGVQVPSFARSPTYLPNCTGLEDDAGKMFGHIGQNGLPAVIVTDALCDPSNPHPYKASYDHISKIVVKRYYAGGSVCYDGSNGADSPLQEIACPAIRASGLHTGSLHKRQESLPNTNSR